MEKKKPISKTLKGMEVGESERFPKLRYSSLMSTKTRLKIERNMEFKLSVESDHILMTRTR